MTSRIAPSAPLIFTLILLMTSVGCSSGSSNGLPAPTITSITLPVGATTRTYAAQTFAASNTSGVATWAVGDGNLPPGVTLSAGGVLSGTPTTAGTYSFQVSVTDARGRTATQAQSIVISDPEFGIITSEIDQEGDGTVDAMSTLTFINATQQITEGRYEDLTKGIVNRRTYIYDNNGNRIAEEYRTDDVLQNVTRYSHDSAGNITRTVRDYGADDVINHIVEREYDENGFVLVQRVDHTADGIFDVEQNWIYSTEAPGHWVTRIYDLDGDGIYDFRDDWQYDAGNPRREIHVDQDSDGDAVLDVEMCLTWTDNPDGTVTRFLERDLDRDGSIDRTDLRIILNGGEMLPTERQANSLLYESDRDGDGLADVVETNTFDSEQRLLRYTSDYDGDGDLEVDYALTYNATGNLATFTNRNGYVVTITYQDWVIGTFDLFNASERMW